MLTLFPGVSFTGGGHAELAAELLCSVETRAVARCWVTLEEERKEKSEREDGGDDEAR